MGDRMALSAGTTGAAEKTETPATMQPAKATKRTKTPVEVFNGSSSKLAKLGGLIDYVGERIEASDFVVSLGGGGGGEVVPTQFEVIRSVYLSDESFGCKNEPASALLVFPHAVRRFQYRGVGDDDRFVFGDTCPVRLRCV